MQQLSDPGSYLGQLGEQARSYLERRTCSSLVPCLIHGWLCSVGPGDVDIDITGSPCQDYSACGNRGPRFGIFFAWILTVRFLQPRILIHENVWNFPVGLLSEILADMYELYVIWVDCFQSGMTALSRQRCYVILYHRRKVQVLNNPSDLYIWLGQQVCVYNVANFPDDFFVASDEAIHEEMCAQAAKRGQFWVSEDLVRDNERRKNHIAQCRRGRKT